MRRWGPVLAIAWVLIVGAITLVGVARNRAGEPEADVVLTERELPIPGWTREEDTGLSLRIAWTGPVGRTGEDATWLDRAKLEGLGFDCRYPVEAKSAEEHYAHALPRDVVLVLEYDGDAWKRWIDARERNAREQSPSPSERTDPLAFEKRVTELFATVDAARESASRLFVVDAGLDAAELRRRYPDRSRYVLARGVVRIAAETAGGEKLATPAHLVGRAMILLVDAVQVPLGRRALLDSLVASDRKGLGAAKPESPGARRRGPFTGKQHPPRYRVHVRWGRRLEPWIVSVEPI